ncbi:hypothetical protein U14_02842 [Candidatus Moduliflexus flocculans]|uniref:bAvd-like domain-containing protein n=1 Tax=Candidatus Moduliflexus flocculans TaxID=1499966 RepID=A0A081BMI1_9BACT|nr:hypothetical protein U14_02842 [Candidatus Moduliflexus flocculans]
MKESPIFVKTFDLLKWVIGHTEKFPKTQRFFLAKRINDALFDFYELIGEAAKIKERQIVLLQQADVRLQRLKHYFRLALELRYVSFDQYTFLVKDAGEVGRLLGGWMKSLDNTRNHREGGSAGQR